MGVKIPSLKKEETQFLDYLEAEILTFLYHLKQRELTSPNTTRMWFSSAQIRTKALENLMQNNRNRLEKELASVILSHGDLGIR